MYCKAQSPQPLIDIAKALCYGQFLGQGFAMSHNDVSLSKELKNESGR